MSKKTARGTKLPTSDFTAKMPKVRKPVREEIIENCEKSERKIKSKTIKVEE